jgi:hypothetical protein
MPWRDDPMCFWGTLKMEQTKPVDFHILDIDADFFIWHDMYKHDVFQRNNAVSDADDDASCSRCSVRGIIGATTKPFSMG